MSIKTRYKTENTKPKKCIIYLRVSTEEQVDNFSLSTQEDICKKEAARRGFEIIGIFREEGRSAKTITGRPVLLELLEYCRKNKKNLSAVFVYRLDRISRQTSDYLAIRKKLSECEISLFSATEPTGNSPTEKLVETMLAGFAQLDNDVRSERTRNGMRARFLAGLNSGPVPLGYLNQNGYAIKDPQTWDKIKEGWDLMLTGSKTLREIAQFLDYQGVNKSFKHKKYKFRAQTANMLFRNKFYMGFLTSSRYPEEIRGQHTPMVTEQQFYKVQAVLDGRNTNLESSIVRRCVDNTDFPLRRIMKCGKCGTVFTGAWTKHHRYAYYFCRSRCGAPSIPVQDIELTLIDFLKKISLSESGLRLLIAYIRKNYMQRVAVLKRRQSEAEGELTKLYALRQSLIEKNLAGVYSDDIFKEQNSIIEEKIKDIQVTKDDNLLGKYNLEGSIKFLEAKFCDLGTTYDNSKLEFKKVLLSSIFPSGMAWNYSGISNSDIGLLYQPILTLCEPSVHVGDPTGIRTLDLLDENQPS
jgi:site-specific DNA recombinase